MVLTQDQQAGWRTWLTGCPPEVIASAVPALAAADRALPTFLGYDQKNTALMSMIGSGGVGAVPNLQFDHALLSVDRWEARRVVDEQAAGQPVLASRVLTAALEQRAINASDGETAAAINRAIRTAIQEAPNTEGNSDCCYAMLHWGPDSSKVGVVAHEGSLRSVGGLTLSQDRTTDGTGQAAVEIAKKEWRSHLKSRMAWRRFILRCKKCAARLGRTGLCDRFTEFSTFLDRMCWNLAVRYIERYLEEHEGRMPHARDTTIYMDVQIEWQMDGMPGLDEAGGPTPAANSPASGSGANPLTRAPTPTPPTTKAVTFAADEPVGVSAACAKMFEGIQKQLEGLTNTMAKWAGVKPTPAAPATGTPVSAAARAALLEAARKRLAAVKGGTADAAPDPAASAALADVPATADTPATTTGSKRSRKRGGKKTGATAAGICHVCAATGHFARDCPTLSDADRAARQVAAAERSAAREAAAAAEAKPQADAKADSTKKE